jgi:hypothetical protein
MLTVLILTVCVIAFIWGLKTMAPKHYADPPELLAVVLAPLVGIVTLLSSCWETALGLVVVGVFGFAMIRTIGAVFANFSGGQLLKVMTVVGVLILALPPLWPVTIPLAVCLVGANLLLAPICLLGSVIRNFMDRDG